VQAWTSLIQHFGNNANSALEGGHKVTKAFLQDSQGDLLTVFKALQLHINSGIQRVIKELADSQNHLPHQINPKNVSVFDEELIQQVMPFALKKVRDQYDLAKSKDYQPVCSGAFEQVYHLPCCHPIHGLIHVNGKVMVELFQEILIESRRKANQREAKVSLNEQLNHQLNEQLAFLGVPTVEIHCHLSERLVNALHHQIQLTL
jgi:hypothetical protein